MRKEFKMSMALHLRALKIQIIATILIATLSIIMVALGNKELQYYYVLIIFYSLISIPVFFLHIEYFIPNRHLRKVLEDGVLQVFHKNEKWKEISRDQILRIELVRRGDYFSALSGYFFHRITLVNGEILFITSLINDDPFLLRNVFAGIPFKEKKRFLCSTLF